METQNNSAYILIVDDIEENVKVLGRVLKEEGYQIAVANNGAQALKIAHKIVPDLILLDVLMPEMDGYEVCRRLKADKVTKDIAIIFVTAVNEEKEEVKGLLLGAVDYIKKPFLFPVIKSRIKRYIDLQLTQKKLIETEKMATLGRLSASIAHELNTPLGAINASSELLKDSLVDSPRQLAKLFALLSLQEQQMFFTFLEKTKDSQLNLSALEKRKKKKSLKQELEQKSIDIDFADILADIGAYKVTEDLYSLLKHKNAELIFQIAHQLSMLNENANCIQIAAKKACKIISAFTNYVYHQHSEIKQWDNITDGIETVLILYQSKLKRGIEVSKDYQQIPKILCYASELEQVWSNLINNAIHAMDNKGLLQIKVFLEGEEIHVQFIDDGKGISKENQGRIFEPFFTTKSVGKGTGVGLDIVRKIVERHSGKITFTSQPGKTIFTVMLPVEQAEK